MHEGAGFFLFSLTRLPPEIPLENRGLGAQCSSGPNWSQENPHVVLARSEPTRFGPFLRLTRTIPPVATSTWSARAQSVRALRRFYVYLDQAAREYRAQVPSNVIPFPRTVRVLTR